MLSETDFSDGLTAGLPQGVVVSHKFGLATNLSNGVISGRELHDCGIIYHPRNPYLLCVMTKSVSSIPDMENVISNISKLTYEEIDSHY